MWLKVSLIAIICVGISAGDNVSGLILLDNMMDWQFKDVAQLEDGSFAVTLGMYFDDLILLHLNSIGELLSEQNNLRVPGRELEGGGWIIPSQEGGCYVVAYSEPRATGVDSDIALFKLTPDCKIKWTIDIGENTDEVYRCFGAAGSENNGVVVLGSGVYYAESAFVRSYSSRGDLIWEYEIDPEAGYLPAGIGQVEDGSLVLLGHHWIAKTYLQKLDNMGNLQWNLELPFTCGWGSVSFSETDSGYEIYFPDGDNSRGAITAIVSESGECLGTEQFEHGMYAHDVALLNNHSAVFSGTRIIDGENVAVLESRDLQGNLNWERQLDGNGEDGFSSICQTEDGEFALLGYSIPDDDPEASCAFFIITDNDGRVVGGTNPSQIPFPVRVIDDRSSD